MVQRRDTMGFIDFIRGKYTEENKSDMIRIFLEEMSCFERYRLETQTFEEIWDDTWCNKQSNIYINEFALAKEKFEKLNISDLLKSTECKYTDTEIGFPKGRKNIYESNIQCALREFREETGYTQSNIQILNDIPWEETFVGTNGIKYRHIYYLVLLPDSINEPQVDIKTIKTYGEICNVKWLSFNECISQIRSYDTKKKEILFKVHEYVVNCFNW
jgi:ADP-ribose pyrophosphatase YjhB (NUDIX family)